MSRPIYNLHYRPVNGIQGFSRETTTALIANIESDEWIRRQRVNSNLNPEHPRASTTDDVECFFSVMRDTVGKSFTLKRVQDEWMKICIEFNKRLDSELPFFYSTTVHDRFNEGERPGFNQKPSKEPQQQRVPQRETQYVNSMVVGRVTLPCRGSVSKRLQFHSGPTTLPCPPALQVHNYCS